MDLLWEHRKKKEEKEKTGTESTSAEKPKIKKVSKFIFIISIIMVVSCILCACGIFMILSDVFAVRISGIVIASVFWIYCGYNSIIFSSLHLLGKVNKFL